MEKELKYDLDIAPESRWNMISATAATKTSLLYMQEVGDFFAGKNYFTTRQGFESYLIKLTVSGCGVLRYNGEVYDVPVGKFYWIDCKKWHDYRTKSEAGDWHVLWVHFYGAGAPFYYDMFQKNNFGSPVGTLPVGSAAYSCLHGLLNLSPNRMSQQEMDLRSANLLVQLLTECLLSSVRHSDEDTIPQYIRSMQLYLEEHYREKITLEQLGQLYNMNPCYLQKQFKQHFGQSPTEYLIYLRMTRAKELMRTTHKPISSIAFEVGIENINYFTRQFKAHEGLTPLDYRRLWPAPMSGEWHS